MNKPKKIYIGAKTADEMLSRPGARPPEKAAVVIKVDNANCQIQCSEQLLNMVRKNCLSYVMEGSEFSQNPNWDGRIYLCSRAGIFPTGLLPRLEEFLTENGKPFRLNDQRNVPLPERDLKIALPDGWKPRYYQEIVANLTDTKNRGVAWMGTGAGKSLTAALVVQKRAVDTLIITPDTGLREQLGDDFKKWFGEEKVGHDVLGSEPIIVANIQSLVKKPKEVFSRFKLLIIDEFHHAAAKTYREINANCINAYYRYGFTGTFVRPDGADMEMFGVLSNVIFRKTTSELIEEGFLVRPYITITRIDISEPGVREGTRRKLRMTYKDAYDFIIQEQQFASDVATKAKQKAAEGKQTLILVRRIEHGNRLQAMIPGSYYLSGKDKKSYRAEVKKAFIEKRVHTLIATNIFGEGQDIPSIDVLINARAEKTEIQTSQGIGRALRKTEGKDKAEVFDYLFVGQKHLEDHSVERLSTYRREKAFKIQVRRG